MDRSIALSFVALALTVSTASAQEGILSRTGTGFRQRRRGIRNAVETEVERGGRRQRPGGPGPGDPSPGVG